MPYISLKVFYPIYRLVNYAGYYKRARVHSLIPHSHSPVRLQPEGIQQYTAEAYKILVQ